jgi:hypothetical protein
MVTSCTRSLASSTNLASIQFLASGVTSERLRAARRAQVDLVLGLAAHEDLGLAALPLGLADDDRGQLLAARVLEGRQRGLAALGTPGGIGALGRLAGPLERELGVVLLLGRLLLGDLEVGHAHGQLLDLLERGRVAAAVGQLPLPAFLLERGGLAGLLEAHLGQVVDVLVERGEQERTRARRGRRAVVLEGQRRHAQRDQGDGREDHDVLVVHGEIS